MSEIENEEINFANMPDQEYKDQLVKEAERVFGKTEGEVQVLSKTAFEELHSMYQKLEEGIRSRNYPFRRIVRDALEHEPDANYEEIWEMFRVDKNEQKRTERERDAQALLVEWFLRKEFRRRLKSDSI